jgi:hypothetical protein
MIVAFGKLKTLVADANAHAIVLTDPQPMGGMNYATVTLNIEHIVDQSAGSPALTVTGQGSNDGVEYADITGMTISNKTTAALHTAEGDVTFAFLRFQIDLDSAGSAAEWAAMTFDLHANLTRK